MCWDGRMHLVSMPEQKDMLTLRCADVNTYPHIARSAGVKLHTNHYQLTKVAADLNTHDNRSCHTIARVTLQIIAWKLATAPTAQILYLQMRSSRLFPSVSRVLMRRVDSRLVKIRR